MVQWFNDFVGISFIERKMGLIKGQLLVQAVCVRHPLASVAIVNTECFSFFLSLFLLSLSPCITSEFVIFCDHFDPHLLFPLCICHTPEEVEGEELG